MRHDVTTHRRAWIEASTKGAVLLFAASELEYIFQSAFHFSPAVTGIMAGCGGGIAQAYTTMGFCTFMKTVEVTRHKSATGNQSTFQIARFVVMSMRVFLCGCECS